MNSLRKEIGMKFSVVNRDDEFSLEMKELLTDVLIRHHWTLDEKDPELVICVGGDGTLLRALHRYIDVLDHVLFVGLHTGTLGFLADYTVSEIDMFISDLLSESYSVESSHLLEMQMDTTDKVFYALNDIRIGSFAESVNFEIYIDGEFFEQTSGSGICISSQVGSSAANRTLGGAVVDNGIEVIELTEIMPLVNKNHHSLLNPYIMNIDREIRVHTLKAYGGLEVSYDHLTMPNCPGRTFRIRTSEKKVRFARFRPYSYLKRLKNIY